MTCPDPILHRRAAGCVCTDAHDQVCDTFAHSLAEKVAGLARHALAARYAFEAEAANQAQATAEEPAGWTSPDALKARLAVLAQADAWPVGSRAITVSLVSAAAGNGSLVDHAIRAAGVTADAAEYARLHAGDSVRATGRVVRLSPFAYRLEW